LATQFLPATSKNSCLNRHKKMAAVSEIIVREYFELNGFLVRQFRKYVAPAGREDDDIDFLVINPHPQPRTGERPFLLNSPDLSTIGRAIVILKAWHTHTFSPALLTNTPELFRFPDSKTVQQAIAGFGQQSPVIKILATSALPHDAQTREQSIAILRSKGIDAAISFRTMLADLVARVESNRDYQKSDLLQLIRILKNYDFIKEQQLDLFRVKRKRGMGSTPRKAPASANPDATTS
jgi:hypothetical protein